MKKALCTQANKFFTEGVEYAVESEDDTFEGVITVTDDEGDAHDLFRKRKEDNTYVSSGGGGFTPLAQFTLVEEACWDGEGYPPIGSTVLYNTDDEEGDEVGEPWKEGDKVEILAYRPIGSSLVAVCWNQTRKDASQRLVEHHGVKLFRPLISQEDKDFEDLLDAICRSNLLMRDGEVAKVIARDIIAANWRKGHE